ncbi:hypothetical protein TrLO_g892 [Triparma laevis f. longispina]|uniref:NAD-dependent epimerase/dehydratase domain-containing protein n=1 Tax=Triparma laevis f. longispina TaxID=1714387 RepID=A0A9W6ZZ78_9STRA|nr:hypothetical protein TrLO_g892 [Triparma laevis f. longispina]
MAPSLLFLLFLVLSPFSPARGLTVPSKSPPKPTVAVLGATGYVGSSVVKALEKRGEVVLRISRTSEGPNSLAVDFTSPTSSKTLLNYLQTHNLTLTSYIHCIGCLFDSTVPFSSTLNKLASGSGTIVNGSYDDITFKTVNNLVNVIEERGETSNVVFISAAEVGWPSVKFGKIVESTAPGFLKRYLKAKRKSESILQSSLIIKSTILRPSIIYNPGASDSALTVNFFNFFSRTKGIIKLPFVDEPISVIDLSEAVCEGLKGEGIWRKEDMIDAIN